MGDHGFVLNQTKAMRVVMRPGKRPRLLFSANLLFVPANALSVRRSVARARRGFSGRRAACRPLRSIGGMDRERAALGRCRVGENHTHLASRIAVRSDASSLCGREKGHACLSGPIFCSFTPTPASGEPARRKDPASTPVCACKLKAKGIYLVAASGATFFVEDTRPPSSSGKCSLPAPAARMMMGALRR